ncbi:hypothetical protein ACWENA_08265 [Streptomyces sp. NPDC004779]
MTWYRTASDADLTQSIELVANRVKHARKKGDKARENEESAVLDNLLDEARRRGWKQGSPWPGR